MPFRNGPNLPTSAEMRILNAVWQLGAATVEEIVNTFPEGQRPNYKTTQAFLRIMENKGFVRHTARGRVFVFEPIVKKDEVDQRSVEALLGDRVVREPAGVGRSAGGGYCGAGEDDSRVQEAEESCGDGRLKGGGMRLRGARLRWMRRSARGR